MAARSSSPLDKYHLSEHKKMARRDRVRAICVFTPMNSINHVPQLFTIFVNLHSILSNNATFSVQAFCNYWDFAS